MPTIIEPLVVELGLDSKGFIEGLARAIENLRQLERRAARSSGKIEESGSGIVAFFRMLDAPLSALRRHFETLATTTVRPQRGLADLAAQGRRTGASIESGALAGAAGLRVLGAVGLTATVAVAALDKVMKSATESAAGVFGVGVRAAGAGVPIGRFSSISQALLTSGNVPEAETQGFLESIRTAQVKAQHGQPQDLIALNQAFALAGIKANVFEGTPEQVLASIAQQFHSVSADVATGLGSMIGRSDTFSQALHDLGVSGLEAAIAAAKLTKITESESQAAKDLTQAHNRLLKTWDAITRKIYDQVDPAFTSLENKLSDFFARMLNPGGDPSKPDKDYLTLGENPTGLPGFITNSSLWKRYMPPWLQTPVIRRGGGSAESPPPGAQGSAFEAQPGETASETSALNKITWNESKGRNVPNAQGSGAFGPWQFIHSTWRTAAAGAGIDIGQYPTAASAPVSVQRQVARWLLRKNQGTDWDVAHGGPMPVGWYRQEADNAAASSVDDGISNADHYKAGERWYNGKWVKMTSRSPFPPGTKFNSRGEPYSASLEHMTAREKANVEAAMRTIKASRGHWIGDKFIGHGWAAHNNDIDINGGVHIHTSATDAKGIADAIPSEIRNSIRRSITSQANTGLN